MSVLYHVSEEPDIERFEPRPSPYLNERGVWAIDKDRLRNYLLPRDCPRVTFYAGPNADAHDVDRLLLGSPAVVAIEADWLERVRMCRLYLYRMPGDTFEVFNRDAGYAISRVAVSPESVEVVDDAVRAIVGRGVELRVVPSLWPLRDAVLASTLSYSFIRMRHAAARIGEEVGDG